MALSYHLRSAQIVKWLLQVDMYTVKGFIVSELSQHLCFKEIFHHEEWTQHCWWLHVFDERGRIFRSRPTRFERFSSHFLFHHFMPLRHRYNLSFQDFCAKFTEFWALSLLLLFLWASLQSRSNLFKPSFKKGWPKTHHILLTTWASDVKTWGTSLRIVQV